MAGAVGIVFALCLLSFTVGAALMYVVVRRHEDASEAPPAPEVTAPGAGDAWVPRPASVEPAEDDYDTRPIHRNPVVGLPRVEPALATFAEQVVLQKPVLVKPVVVEEPAGEEPVVEEEPVAEEPEPEVRPGEPALPAPATPQPEEQTTSVERADFRQRYLRTFEEARRKAGSGQPGSETVRYLSETRRTPPGGG
jgi:hypothetical protein